MQINNNNTYDIVYSIYIPRLPAYVNEAMIAEVFMTHLIGYVKRVDFVPVENDETLYKAFVHLYYVWDNFLEKGEEKEEEPFKLYFEDGTYWMLLKNKNPVKETRQNMCQVVENHKILEEKVAAMQDMIEKQQAQIDQLMRIIEQQQESPKNENKENKELSKMLKNILHVPCRVLPMDNLIA